MTAIAYFSLFGVSFMMGDLLLSRSGRKRDSVSIPSFPNINKFVSAESDFSFVGAIQKINILSDRLMVGWAGNRLQATLALKEIRELDSKSEILTPEAVSECIQSIPESDRDELSLIFSIGNPNSEVTDGASVITGGYSLERYNIGNVDTLFSGSGTKELLEIIPNLLRSTNWKSKFQENGKKSVVEFMYSLLSLLVGYESFTRSNLKMGWGAGFEFAYYNGTKFEKLDNTLFVFFTLSELINGSTRFLKLNMNFLKYYYIGDTLLIQQLILIKNEDGNNHSNRNYYFCRPLLKKGSDFYKNYKELPAPDWNYDALVSIVYDPEGGKHRFFSSCFLKPEPNTKIYIKDSVSNVEFGFDEEFQSILENSIGAGKEYTVKFIKPKHIKPKM